MPSVLVILAEGFEELEATAPVTILRRAQVDVVMAGLASGPVKGARGVTVVPDASLESVADHPFDAVVLPGGFPGTTNLKKSELVAKVVKEAAARGAIVAAICAGPSVLAAFGLLTGRCATSHSSVRDELLAAKVEIVSDKEVVEDGRIVTSRGAGTAVPFGLHLVKMLAGDAKLAEVRKGMMLG
jgi:4-methyl-5(b-hydroxyethyl)-thiazole monophosphate biosynthesis